MESMTVGRATVQTEDLLKVLFVFLVALLTIGILDPAFAASPLPDSLSSALESV
jgi:hypothetical protein